MYYSKTSATQIAIPKNYDGNAFFTSKENVPSKEDFATLDEGKDHSLASKEDCLKSTKIENKGTPNPLPFDISVEDLLLLGLIFVIYQSDPQDPTLIVLLILLLVK